jgi:hypothetical protein
VWIRLKTCPCLRTSRFSGRSHTHKRAHAEHRRARLTIFVLSAHPHAAAALRALLVLHAAHVGHLAHRAAGRVCCLPSR